MSVGKGRKQRRPTRRSRRATRLVFGGVTSTPPHRISP